MKTHTPIFTTTEAIAAVGAQRFYSHVLFGRKISHTTGFIALGPPINGFKPLYLKRFISLLLGMLSANLGCGSHPCVIV